MQRYFEDVIDTVVNNDLKSYTKIFLIILGIPALIKGIFLILAGMY